MPTDFEGLAGLLGMQQSRQREMKRNLELARTSGGRMSTGATNADVDALEEDMVNDPYTGDAEKNRIAGIQSSLDRAATFLRPEVTQARNQQQAFDLEKASLSGDAARDVAAINAQGDVAAAKARGESGGGGWAEPTVQIPDPYGTGGVYAVPRTIAANPESTKQFIDQYRAQGMPGMRGQADRSKIDAFNTLIDVMGGTYQQGEKAGWKGIGPVAGPVGDFFKKFGIGSDDEESLRTQLGRVRTREAFGEGGKQFTGTEERLVNSFLAGINQNPEMAKVRMNEGLNHARNILRNLGVSEAQIEARISAALRRQQGAGTGTGADLITDPNWGAR